MTLEKLLSKYLLLPLSKKEAVFCFYIEKKARLKKFHVIHVKTCDLLPEEEGRNKLGFFDSLDAVVKAGKDKFSNVKLCKYCCNFDDKTQ